MLIDSPLQQRVQTLGSPYGLTSAALRSELIAFDDTIGQEAGFSMQDTAHMPRNAN
jgi:hypothetical protein